MRPVPSNPWEWLYEREAQPLKAYVLDEVARQLAAAVERFPPDIDAFERPEVERRFALVLAENRGRPSLPCVRVALKLYRWDLEREIELIDRYVKGGHLEAEAHLSRLEWELAQLLWQYWLDQTLAFSEYAQGKFRRAELTGLADRLWQRLVTDESPLRA